VISPADSSSPAEWYCPTCEKPFAAGERCPTDGTRLVTLSAAADPFIGRDLDGRYTIVEKLGQGGMGVVYRGLQHSVGRDCAIKVISPSQLRDAEAMKRFLREAKLASRLSHPNAVAVHDFGQTSDGVFYLAMELVEGRTLDDVLRDHKVFEPHRVVRIGSQVCDALEGAHALQIVHRDLKPSNIMLLSRGRDHVKVLDFGLAKSLAPDTTPTTLTGAGDLVGTPAFMPPELALGQPCDSRSDLYSLGCVLYLLGSGRLPFRAASMHELIAMHGSEPAQPMTGVPAALARVINRMLEKHPAARYQSASECREALEAAVEGRLSTPVPSLSHVDTRPGLGQFLKATDDVLVERLPKARPTTSPPVMTAKIRRRPSRATSDGVTVSKSPKRRPRTWLIPAIAASALAVAGGVFAFTLDDTPDGAPSLPPAAVTAPATPVTPPSSEMALPAVTAPATPMTPPSSEMTLPAVTAPATPVTPPSSEMTSPSAGSDPSAVGMALPDVAPSPKPPPSDIKPAAKSHKPKSTPGKAKPSATPPTTKAPHTD
jgi:serine/threonine-protein kinase